METDNNGLNHKAKPICHVWQDLTIHQRISLKGFFQTEPALVNCKAIMKLWGWREAIDYFLDPSKLPNPITYI